MAESDWLIIELNEGGDDLSYRELETAVVDVFGDNCEYFIPMHYEEMGTYKSTSVLFNGYVFIKKDNKSMDKLPYLTDNKVFLRVLESNGRIQTISSRVVGSLKRKLKKTTVKNLQPGTPVLILDGIFRNLEGEIISIEDCGKKAMVKISRLSREMVAPLPSTMIMEYRNSGVALA